MLALTRRLCAFWKELQKVIWKSFDGQQTHRFQQKRGTCQLHTFRLVSRLRKVEEHERWSLWLEGRARNSTGFAQFRTGPFRGFPFGRRCTAELHRVCFEVFRTRQVGRVGAVPLVLLERTCGVVDSPCALVLERQNRYGRLFGPGLSAPGFTGTFSLFAQSRSGCSGFCVDVFFLYFSLVSFAGQNGKSECLRRVALHLRQKLQGRPHAGRFFEQLFVAARKGFVERAVVCRGFFLCCHRCCAASHARGPWQLLRICAGRLPCWTARQRSCVGALVLGPVFPRAELLVAQTLAQDQRVRKSGHRKGCRRKRRVATPLGAPSGQPSSLRNGGRIPFARSPEQVDRCAPVVSGLCRGLCCCRNSQLGSPFVQYQLFAVDMKR